MNDHPIKNAVDVAAAGTAIATVANWLPAVAALFTIIWTGIRIVESKTVQALIARWRK